MRLLIGRKLKKLLELLEEHLSLIALLSFVIIILYASWLFYNYVYRSTSFSPEISFEKVKIKKATFERVIKQLELRESNVLDIMEKEYLNVFK